MDETCKFFNISPIQFFYSTQDEDIDDIEVLDDIQGEDIEVTEALDEIQENLDDTDILDKIQEEDLDDIDIPDEIQEEDLDDIDDAEIPNGSIDGVIAKISVVLAQLVIPINITSSIDLPQEAFEIKDVNKKLNLTECILLQPTNVLFVKGFINNSIEYSKMNLLNSEKSCGMNIHYTVDIPFECSVAVNFFTQPLNPIANTKEVFKYSGIDVPELNQVSEEFFNEIPFGKLLSTKIIESVQFINLKDSTEGFIQIEENMVIELRMEILQNQPIIIPPFRKNYNQI